MFDRCAIRATRTPNERIVAAGAGEVAKLLSAGEAKVAVRAASGRSRYSQAIIERPVSSVLLALPLRVRCERASLQ
jgi:hypothetical protein